MSAAPQAADRRAEESRDHLVSARVALFEADLALAMGNPRAARIQLDLAQAYLAECSKSMAAVSASPLVHRPLVP